MACSHLTTVKNRQRVTWNTTKPQVALVVTRLPGLALPLAQWNRPDSPADQIRPGPIYLKVQANSVYRHSCRLPLLCHTFTFMPYRPRRTTLEGRGAHHVKPGTRTGSPAAPAHALTPRYKICHPLPAMQRTKGQWTTPGHGDPLPQTTVSAHSAVRTQQVTPGSIATREPFYPG